MAAHLSCVWQSTSIWKTIVSSMTSFQSTFLVIFASYAYHHLVQIVCCPVFRSEGTWTFSDVLENYSDCRSRSYLCSFESVARCTSFAMCHGKVTAMHETIWIEQSCHTTTRSLTDKLWLDSSFMVKSIYSVEPKQNRVCASHF